MKVEVKDIKGIPEAEEMEEVKDIGLFIKPGDKAGLVKTGLDRHGFAVIVSDSLSRAKELSAYLDKSIEIEYEKKAD